MLKVATVPLLCRFALTAIFALACTLGLSAGPNILFIAADDLRPDLGAYGSREAKTPNIDALARRGVVFDRAYCQQAVCNPSRASVMTGRRPDTLKVWDLRTHFRETLPDIVTIPQYFKANGYTAVGIGKLFHNEVGAKPAFSFADPISWSEPPTYANGAHWQDWVVPGNPSGPKSKGGPVQCLDVPDDAYFDGQIATSALARLQQLADGKQPFFLAVGFWKPHLPFNAPKKYWDIYDRAMLSRPRPSGFPTNAPSIAGHDWNELRGYAGVPRTGPLDEAKVMELRHGYLACISFLDAQVGRLLAGINRLGLAENTVVIFWSDHGFHLGEHSLWAKTTNYELDTRVPLIVAAPGAKQGARAAGLVELLDLYPTLAELAGLPVPPELEGQSFAMLLREPERAGKEVAISQHPHPSYGKSTHMGYAVRTETVRFVEWRDIVTGEVFSRELYDHAIDPAETINRASDPNYTSIVRRCAAQVAKLVVQSGRWHQ